MTRRSSNLLMLPVPEVLPGVPDGVALTCTLCKERRRLEGMGEAASGVEGRSGRSGGGGDDGEGSVSRKLPLV